MNLEGLIMKEISMMKKGNLKGKVIIDGWYDNDYNKKGKILFDGKIIDENNNIIGRYEKN